MVFPVGPIQVDSPICEQIKGHSVLGLTSWGTLTFPSIKGERKGIIRKVIRHVKYVEECSG
jgi:hypothetical protein